MPGLDLASNDLRPFATPGGGALGASPPKKFAEMGLIREPAAQSDVAQREIAREHQDFRALQPAADDVRMCRFVECALECPAEIGRAQLRNGAERLETNGLIQSGVDEEVQPAYLPGHQSSRPVF